MNELTFSGEGFSDYTYWQTKDKRIATKINSLLKDIQRNGPMKGIGKPEALRYQDGYSRRIDAANRLVYEIDELQNIRIVSCKGHYDD